MLYQYVGGLCDSAACVQCHCRLTCYSLPWMGIYPYTWHDIRQPPVRSTGCMSWPTENSAISPVTSALAGSMRFPSGLLCERVPRAHGCSAVEDYTLDEVIPTWKKGPMCYCKWPWACTLPSCRPHTSAMKALPDAASPVHVLCQSACVC